MKHSNQPICPKCAAVIPDEAPGGLCPKCALEGVATAAKITPGARKSAPPGIGEIAPHFPELEILELIGAGGMGAVYKARQPQLDRFVALKILSHDLAGDPTFVERFNREARVLARLSHPNIVGIHDFGTAGPYCYLLMEYVDGVNLRQAMRAGRFTPTEALEMVQHLCSALKFAHEEGILHRDIKPENILIDSKGRVKIADFGIAKLVGEDRQHDLTLTLQGSVLGSPHYMAPEQIETPGDVDQRADIYSLGVVLYEMLTGGLPIGRFALPSEKAEMDARIDHIVMRTLEKERGARYQSVGEVSTEVEALGKSPAPPAMKAVASHGEPQAARYSLAAAILTAISLPLVIFAFLIQGSNNASSFSLIVAIVRILCLLIGVMSAITGFILGARALGGIRRSGGVKTGLGSAIFASAVLPILILFILSTLPMKITSPGDGLHLGPVAVIFVVLLPAIITAWLLVRSLYRWAGGAQRKDGTRFHPGLGIPLLMVIFLTVGGPLLLTGIAARIFSGGENRLSANDSRIEAMMKKVQMQHEASSSSDVFWCFGKAEVFMHIFVKPGQTISMRLLAQRPDGSSSAIDLGELAIPHGDPGAVREDLEVGTYIRSDSGNGRLQALAAVFPGGKGSIHSREDLSGWKFSDSLPDELEFDAPGRKEYTLATLAGKGKQERDGKLILEVIVTDSAQTDDFPKSR